MSAREDIHRAATDGTLTEASLLFLVDTHGSEVLSKAADELVAYCPDHGDRDTGFITCQCLAADDLRRMATTE